VLLNYQKWGQNEKIWEKLVYWVLCEKSKKWRNGKETIMGDDGGGNGY
jgi:hypothetical protein